MWPQFLTAKLGLEWQPVRKNPQQPAAALLAWRHRRVSGSFILSANLNDK